MATPWKIREWPKVLSQLCGVSVLSAHTRALYGCFLPQSKDVRIRLFGDSKLVADVKLRVNGCLLFCLSLVADWQPIRMCPASRLVTAQS